MSIPYPDVIRNYLKDELNPTSPFYNVSLKGGQLGTRTIEDYQGKDLKTVCQKQKKIFIEWIRKLRDPSLKTVQTSKEGDDSFEKKATILFNRSFEIISALPDSEVKPFIHRHTLASALEQHMNENLIPAKMETHQIAQGIVASLQPSLEKKLDLAKDVPFSKPRSTSISSSPPLPSLMEGVVSPRARADSKVRHHVRSPAPQIEGDTATSQELTPPSSPRRDSLGSQFEIPEVAKAQAKLTRHEADFGEFVTQKLNEAELNSYINYWKKSDKAGVERLLTQTESDKMYPRFKSLAETPLTGLALQETTARMLKTPNDFQRWAQNLIRQAAYIKNGKVSTTSPSKTQSPLTDKERFKQDTESFLRLLEGILNSLPANFNKSKPMIITAWKEIVGQEKEDEINNESGKECCALFLERLFVKKLFTKELLKGLIPFDAYLLNSLGLTVVQLLYSFSQGSYVTPGEEVNAFCSRQKYSPIKKSAVESRSFEYFIELDGEIRTEVVSKMEFAKNGHPPVTIAIRNTLTSSLALIPNWESKLVLEVSSALDRHTLKTDILLPLIKLGFTVRVLNSETQQ